jgi:hypothetical protein
MSAKSKVSSAQTTEREERDKKRIKEFEKLIADFFSNTSTEIAHSIKQIVDSLKTTLEAKAED